MSQFTIQEISPKTQANLQQERALFKHAFATSYSKLPAGQLILPPSTTLEQFIDSAFDEEDTAWANILKSKNKKPAQRFYHAETNGKNSRKSVIGYISVDVLENGKGVYIRQMAVSPSVQKRGVGRSLLQACIKDVSFATVCYRKTNEGAKLFYGKLGFVPMTSTAHGLDENIYNGMIWKRSEGIEQASK